MHTEFYWMWICQIQKLEDPLKWETVTNMKLITVINKCKKKNEDNNNINVKSNLKRCYWQIWNFQVSKFETDYQCNPEKYFCHTRSEKDNKITIYRGSYTSGHFIWNLWNEPSTTSVRFCLSYICFKWEFIDLKVEIISTGNITLSRTASWRYATVTKCYVTSGHTIWHDVSHWITATSYDKSS